MYHVRYTAAMHPILNYVEFRTNPEPYMVQGVVHEYGALNYVEFRAAMHYVESMACHAPHVVHGAPGRIRTCGPRIRSP